jgi:hypothetical protein
MPIPRLPSLCPGPIALGMLMASSAAFGDVTIEERMRVDGAGVMQMANMTGRTVTTISGDRARSDSEMSLESRLMRMFGDSGPSVAIVRLDQDAVYELDTKKKTYTVSTFAEQRAQMQQAMQQMRDAQQTQQQGAAGVDQSDCEWSEPEVETDRTGESQQIAGLQADRVVVTATQSCADRKSQQVCDFRLTLDQWLAADYTPAEEALNYYRAYAEKLGLETVGSEHFAQRVESMFGGYGGLWGEIGNRLAAEDGYPVRSTVSLAIGGPQCESMQEMQTAATAARPAVGEAIGSAVGGTVGGALGGALGGMFGKKRAAAEPEPAAQPQPPTVETADGMVRLMSIETELVSVSRQAVDAATFEIPAGYRKAR